MTTSATSTTSTLALASTSTIIRLSLHVLAACVWLGGQIVVAGLLPTVRSLGPDAPQKVARAFGRLSWPAFWLLVLTGFWNYASVHGESMSSSWNTAFAIKMVCVLLAGVGTFMHTKASTSRARGVFAGIGTLAPLAALVLGIALAG
jgi:putative copper export protein